MARPQKTATDTKPLSRRVLVNIRRDQTTSTPRVVWAHEIPLLEGMFGEGNVQEVDPSVLDEGYSAKAAPDLLTYNKVQDAFRRPSESLGIGFVFIDNARAEFDRLAGCYGKHPDVNEAWVENVYGRFASGAFAAIVGSASVEDLPAEQLRQLVLAYGYALPIVTHESSEAERKAASAAVAEFRSLPAAKLREIAGQVGVEIGA